ncbi:hypothetical protein BU24DRAFT_424487 [Aaosphaeria arxii CBS 175.79]|uniref:Uncharacterized protein n=1 Tax=Aaosphaeria arxii CBS 175.79 TaxID=1450172 RepID=A0A6A5XKT2_9PLEO|nr:uncharacterized protein BU24DRAFT_424487 [Aaosphaeria arxii CBS 175.79]KAF2013471.1 hypothetical protein BU24DRAFT_424487 [Aaosphaeria arxii CBS 175.79]
MTATTQFFTALAGIFFVAGLAVYLFGIPPELKRKLERSALKAMGENKMSYIAKDQISKIPASDQEDVKQLKTGLGNAVGGGMKNPLGEAAGETADTLTSPFTGR